ncbi:hypothetical protein BDY19DRAFT_993914 [Irpex rosettiformis]|uniref:Uncharacterized protein n=1 Tax=Irpex rosettiformis TaxID=378272 RepID=A0ACB8U2B6_9APHY|nr:hypothetical protein BDY19DRAFT_993914 [Irpex rosettiformis]
MDLSDLINAKLTADLSEVDCSQTRVVNSGMFMATSTGDMCVPAPGGTSLLSTHELSIVERELGDLDLRYINDEVHDHLPIMFLDSVTPNLSITSLHFASSTLLVSADTRELFAENVHIIKNLDSLACPLETSNVIATTASLAPSLALDIVALNLNVTAKSNLSCIEESPCHVWTILSKSADIPTISLEDLVPTTPTGCINTQDIGKLEDLNTHMNALVTSCSNDTEPPVVKIAKLSSYPATTASIANMLTHSFSSSHSSRSVHLSNCLALGFTDATYQEASQDIRANLKHTCTTVI